MITTNVKTCFFMVQLAAPHLEKTKGNVVIVSSTLSVMNWPDAIAYSVSKAALDKLTFTFALALAPKGVRVNGVNPSFIPTRVIRDWASSEEKEKETAHGFAATIGPLHPLHGRCATSDEFADCVLFWLLTMRTISRAGGLSWMPEPIWLARSLPCPQALSRY